MLSHPLLVRPFRSPRACASRGQTLVEFALVLIPVMLLTLGLIDGIRVIFYYSQVQEAARQGARWGAVQVARQIAGSSATVGGDLSVPGNAPATTEVTSTDPTFTGQAVTVTMTYPFKPVLGMVFNGVSIAIKGTSSMLHE